MEEVVGSIPTRSTISLYSIETISEGGPSALARLRISPAGSRSPSLRFGSLTPAKRLKFDPDQVHHSFYPVITTMI